MRSRLLTALERAGAFSRCLDDETDLRAVLDAITTEAKAIVDQAIAERSRSCQYAGCGRLLVGLYWQTKQHGDVCNDCHKQHGLRY